MKQAAPAAAKAAHPAPQAHAVVRDRPAGPLLQRKCGGCASGSSCSGCQEEDDPRVQRHAVGGAHDTAPAAGVPASVRAELGSAGSPLPDDTRREMEAGFGHDFSRVRVHHSSSAAADVGAHAFTVGSHVVFSPGNWSPGTSRGRYLLAHELAHVVQQSRAGTVDLDRLSVDTQVDSAPEREADVAAAQVLSGRRVSGPSASPLRLQRHALCAPILALPDTGARGIGIAADAAIKADFRSKVPNATTLAIPTGAAVPMSTEGCEEDAASSSIKPQQIGGARTGIGKPDLVARFGTHVEVAEIKIGTWTCVPFAEAQVAQYVDKGLSEENEAWRKANGIETMGLMPTTRFAPRSINVAGGAAILVGWCAPGLIVYKPISKRFRKRAPKKEESESKEDATQPSAAAVPANAGAPSSTPAGATEPATAPAGVPAPARVAVPADDPSRATDTPPVDVDDPLVDVMTAARLARVLSAMARQAPKKAPSAAGRAAGPVYAAATVAAVILVMSKGAEASVGLEGDDAIEAAFKSMADQGEPLPDDLKEAIKNDPALMEALKQAGDPATADAAKRALGEKLLRTIEENRDQFTDEELTALLQAGEDGGAVPAGDPTVAEIKEQIARKKKGDKPASGSGGLDLGPSGEPADPSAPSDPAPEDEQPPKIEMSDETREQLADSPNTRKVLKVLLGKKGELIDEAFVKSLLEVVSQADPPLTAEEVEEMSKRAASAEGHSKEEVLDSVRTAIAERGQEPSGGATADAAGDPGSGEPGDDAAAAGKDGTPGQGAGGESDSQPASPPAPARAPGNAIPIEQTDTSEATRKRADANKGEAKKYADTLNDEKTKAFLEGLPTGQLMVAYQAPAKMAEGAVFPKSFLIGRLEDGTGVMGSCQMVATKALGGGQWEAVVIPGPGLYFASGKSFGRAKRSTHVIDFAAIQERRKAQAEAKAAE